MKAQSPNFPWSAVIGQDALKRALILCAIDPAIGGVLVQGPRGVAKTTLARALGELMQGAFVELPLGATEERVTGSLDLDAALRDGRVAFSPGLLARAHQGVLYVDEVNLLPDALVDLLLDAAASGQNSVERDGVSHSHPARFVLVGTMNPEEGELRPQLIDRFGLCASADHEIKPEQRAEIVLRRLAFDADPEAFRARFAAEQTALVERCQRARLRAQQIPLAGPALAQVVERCYAARVEGVRADVAMLRAARAHAAWHERGEIALEDVEAVAELALGHRRRAPERDPGPRGGGAAGGSNRGGESPTPRADAADSGRSRAEGNGARAAQGGGSENAGQPPRSDVAPLGTTQQRSSSADSDRGALAAVPVQALVPGTLPKWLAAPSCERGVGAHARRGKARRRAPLGVRAAGRAENGAIDWFNTLCAHPRPGQHTQLRYRARRAAHEQLWLVAIDSSSSMLRGGALALAKGVAHALQRAAWRARAEIALIAFGNDRVGTHAGHARYGHALAALGGGGGTPLRPALLAAFALCRQRRFAAPALYKRLIVLSDGRSRESLAELAALSGELDAIVIDCERGPVRLGRAATLAESLGGVCVHVDALR